MVQVCPFTALRPPMELAAAVAVLPYDVMDVAEARLMAAGNANSFLHVSRPEIDLPADTDPHSAEVYARGRSNLGEFRQRGVLRRDAAPTYFVYRQRMGEFEQTGIVAVVSVADYDSGAVRTHEHTRPDKELDRVTHIEALDAQDEPVFLLSQRSSQLDELVAHVVKTAPVADFTSNDNVSHTVWCIAEAKSIETITEIYAGLDRLYVADGHHRSAAASRVHEHRSAAGAAGEHGWFLAVIFPADEVHVLPYNRVITLAGLTVADLVLAMGEKFEVTPVPGPVTPDRRHVMGIYGDRQWYEATLRPGMVDDGDRLAALDVAVLQDLVLTPLLGITDPRTDQRLTFVGGIRGVAELTRLVDDRPGSVAISLPPTAIEDLLAVADAGLVMPPKSTWFEPKLRSGLFLHPLT